MLARARRQMAIRTKVVEGDRVRRLCAPSWSPSTWIKGKKQVMLHQKRKIEEKQQGSLIKSIGRTQPIERSPPF